MINEEKISQDLLNSLDKIKSNLIARINKGNFSQVDLAELSGQIDFFQELQSLGLNDLLEDYFKNYETVIKDILSQAEALGVRNITGASLGDLDAFIDVKADELLGKANYYAKQLKTELLKNIIAGEPINNIVSNLSQIPLTDNQLRVAVNTGISEFQRIGTAKVYEDDEEIRFRLEGVDDNRNRPSCEVVLKYQPKEGWTKQEIDNGAATKLVKEHASEFAKSSSELEQALKYPYSFTKCGGYNCRHRFSPIGIE